MARFKVGIQSHLPGFRMELEEQPPTVSNVLSTIHRYPGYLSRQFNGHGSSNQHQFHQISGTFVPRPKTWNRRKTCSFGPLQTKHFHQMSLIQDDNTPGRQNVPVPRVLDHVSRLKGRLLSRPNTSLIFKIPRVYSRQEKAHFFRYGLWPQHRTENIYQIDKRGNSKPKKEGCQNSGLPGRFFDMGLFQRKVRGINSHRTSGITRERVPNKPIEKSIDSESNLRIFGTHLGHGQLEYSASRQASSRSHQGSKASLETTDHIPQRVPKHSRSDQFHINCGPTEQMHGEALVPTYPSFQIPQEIASANVSPDWATHLASKATVEFISAPDATSTFGRHLYGFFRLRLGLPHLNRREGQRRMVPAISTTTHQFERIDRSVVCLTGHSSEAKHSYQGIFGQLDNCLCPETGRVISITSPQFLGVFHPQNSEEESVVPYDRTYCGSSQRLCGHAIQEDDMSNRMATRQVILPGSTTLASRDADRLVCHKEQHPTGQFHIAVSGQSRHRFGCNDSRLEPMVQNLPLPSYREEVDIGYTGQIGGVSGERHPNSPFLARGCLVSTSPGHVHPERSPQLLSIPEIGEEDNPMRIFFGEKPSGLDALRRCYAKKFGTDIAESMARDSRDSTLKQYDSIFRLFANLFVILSQQPYLNQPFLTSSCIVQNRCTGGQKQYTPTDQH